MPQKETLDKAAYTCLLVFYRRLSPLFQFSLSAVTLVYLSQWLCSTSNSLKFQPQYPQTGNLWVGGGDGGADKAVLNKVHKNLGQVGGKAHCAKHCPN